MIALLWAKCWKYIAAVGALLLAVIAIFLKGRASGEAKQDAKVAQAQHDAEVAKQSQQAVETRHDIDTSVQALPEAPAQTVASAPVVSAAGKLRDDGWMRPDDGN